MKQITREKAALVFFIGLALFGLVCVLTYIVLFGHSLNATASSIDDATGNLEGYTALVYEGVAEEDDDDAIQAQTPEQEVANLNPVMRTVAPLNDRALYRYRMYESETASTSDDEVTASDVADSDESAEDQQKATVFGVMCSYRDKNAAVIEVDVTNSRAYNETTIVRANGKTFGFISLDRVSAVPHYLDKRVAEYEELNTDLIVAVVSDLSLLSNYDGVDIVISTKNEDIASSGVVMGSTFVNDAAQIGQVGTILVSPSRSVSAKDVTSL